MRLQEIKKIFHKELSGIFPKEEIDSFFYLSIEHYLGLERFILALQPGLVIDKQEEDLLFEALNRLKQQEPIQYILGETQFADLRFMVDESVLIPRPETEELVRWIQHDYQQPESPPSILDIGTGSGCIAVSLAKYIQGSHVYATDISQEALEIASKNAAINGVKVEFLHSDITTTKTLGRRFDVIVSNPPYVRSLEKEEMSDNVVKYEPDIALFVPDKDPLMFYRHIARFANENLIPGGAVYLELNQYLAGKTATLFEDENFSEIELRKDLYGNDRLLRVKESASM